MKTLYTRNTDCRVYVTEGISDSKKCLRFRQVLFNPRQTMRILPPARAPRFPRVFQNFQPVNANVHSDYIARAPNATEKVWWHYYPVEETFQGAFTNHNLCCYPTSHSRPSWRTRYRGSRPSATRAYRSLQGVVEKSVEPPKCSILMFLTA